jgi:hypothetical protein
LILIDVAVSLLVACSAPKPAHVGSQSSVAQTDVQTVLEGSMEVLIEDSNQGSRTLYFLVFADRRVSLRFLRNPVNLVTGTHVRVRGQWEKDTLVVTAIDRI